MLQNAIYFTFQYNFDNKIKHLLQYMNSPAKKLGIYAKYLQIF